MIPWELCRHDVISSAPRGHFPPLRTHSGIEMISVSDRKRLPAGRFYPLPPPRRRTIGRVPPDQLGTRRM